MFSPCEPIDSVFKLSLFDVNPNPPAGPGSVPFSSEEKGWLAKQDGDEVGVIRCLFLLLYQCCRKLWVRDREVQVEDALHPNQGEVSCGRPGVWGNFLFRSNTV